MKEPLPSDYPFTTEGAAEYVADMELYRKVQKNNMLWQKRQEAAKLLSQNDALPPTAGVPGSRLAQGASPLSDVGFAGLAVGANVAAPVQGLIGSAAEAIQYNTPDFLPDAIRAPIRQTMDSIASSARSGRDNTRKFAEGIGRYLEARRLLKSEASAVPKFDTPSAILAGGEAARQLIGGPTLQAALAYGERDSVVDAAVDVLASKVGKKIASAGNAGTREVRQKLADLLTEKAATKLIDANTEDDERERK